MGAMDGDFAQWLKDQQEEAREDARASASSYSRQYYSGMRAAFLMAWNEYHRRARETSSTNGSTSTTPTSETKGNHP